MNFLSPKRPFHTQLPDAAGVISWVHFGDLHMTKVGEQNHLDLAAIVNEVNQAFAGSVGFVFLPGDVADDGSRAAYVVVRGELDRLNVPWYAIIGDHDVNEKSFANFLAAMSEPTMRRIDESHVWQAEISAPREGVPALKVSFEDARGDVATDEIRVAIGQRAERECAERDQDNALDTWSEHGLLGTQLGPNRNGKKW